MKYYRDGRPVYESTGTTEKREAQRKLNERLGQVATGIHPGPHVERTAFEELVAGIRQDYAINKWRSAQRLNEYIQHLTRHFQRLRASGITTDRIQQYILERQQEGAMNGTINRELGALKRMFKLPLPQTPPKVARIPHVPKLEEHNVRSGFASYEDFLAGRGALPDHGKVAISIVFWLGLRSGEVLSLKWSQGGPGNSKVVSHSNPNKNRSIACGVSPPRSACAVERSQEPNRSRISGVPLGLSMERRASGVDS